MILTMCNKLFLRKCTQLLVRHLHSNICLSKLVCFLCFSVDWVKRTNCNIVSFTLAAVWIVVPSSSSIYFPLLKGLPSWSSLLRHNWPISYLSSMPWGLSNNFCIIIESQIEGTSWVGWYCGPFPYECQLSILLSQLTDYWGDI